MCWNTVGDYAVIFISAILIVICFTFPFISYSFLVRNIDKMVSDKEFITKYGSLFTELRATRKSALLNNVFFMIRRIVFVLSAIYLNDYPYIQIDLLII